MRHWKLSVTAVLLTLLPTCPLLASTDHPIKSAVAAPAPPLSPDGEVVFVVSGDNRPTGRGAPLPRTVREIFSEIGLIRPDFVLWTGDTVFGYGDSVAELRQEYKAFLDIAAIGGAPVFNAPGNHEIHGDKNNCGNKDSEREFEQRWGNLYGSFDYAGMHFIALDSDQICQESIIPDTQLAWLKADLEANRSASAIFVFSHQEFFSSPTIDEDQGRSHPPLDNRDALHELFKGYPVRAVFSGHEHLYYRESHDGIEYVIAGGAGAPLYASADRGGFTHYVVVRVSKAGAITYDVIEPGRLSVEPGQSKTAEKKLFVENANNSEIPLRGVPVTVPGPCPLAARSDLKKSDGTPIPVEVTVRSCVARAGKASARLSLRAPRRVTVPVFVGAAPKAAP